jgi:hypothetical protein
MGPAGNRTSVVEAVADCVLVLCVAATTGSCRRVTGVAGGVSSCCASGRRRMGSGDQNTTWSRRHTPRRWVRVEFTLPKTLMIGKQLLVYCRLRAF